MAQLAASHRTADIHVTCNAFEVNETCYRFQAKLPSENTKIDEWRVHLPHSQRD
jgi:putative transposase